MMLGTLANLGVLSLKSHVMTPGNLNLIVYNPPSISLVTCTSPLVIVISEAKVAYGQSSSPANICPV